MEAVFEALLITLIQVLVPVALGALIALAKKQWERMKLQIDNEQWDIAVKVAQQLVFAAEQTGLIDAAMAVGNEKKAWVLAQLQAELEERGIKIDVSKLSALIEAEVYKAFQASAEA